MVMDNESEEVFAFLTLSDYERMLDGGEASWKEMNEQEMLNKVNRDIANWRALHDDEDDEEENWKNFSENAVEDWKPDGEEAAPEKEKEAESVLEPVEEKIFSPETIKPTVNDKNEFVGKGEEEKLDDLSSEDQDTFLLEPV